MSDSENSDSAAEVEAAVAEAEGEVASASGQLDAACEAREQAEAVVQEIAAELEALRSELERLQEEQAILSQALEEATRLLEETQTQYAAHQGNVEALVEEAARRLACAQEALTVYLSNNPNAAYVAQWLRPSVSSTAVLRPNDLHSRLRLTRPQIGHFVNYLAASDAGFYSKLRDYRQQLQRCNGTAEVLQVQQKVRKYMSGYVGEAIVCHAFRPFAGRVDTQKRTYFHDGRYTKTDVEVSGLKVPVILGKGEGRYAPVGGSIKIEVKCGQKEYLYSQKEHLLFQSGGHKGADAALTLCSADIQDLSEPRARELRNELSEAGSPLMGMLPRKEEIDAACWAYINDRDQEN